MVLVVSADRVSTTDAPGAFGAAAPASEPAVAGPPCFFWRVCGRRAALEKQGKSVCPTCAARLKGTAYPLRAPTRAPLYRLSRDAAEALDMVEKHRKKRDRNEPVTGRPRPC